MKQPDQDLIQAFDPTRDTCFLHFEGVSKSYLEAGQERVVLKNACACIGKGEFVTILGKSGTGKSTLLNLISGIDLVDAGRVWVGGRELTALPERERTLFRREHIGFIFQFFNLIPTLTVWENVILPAELKNTPVAMFKDKAQLLLDKVGLLDRLNTFPDRLSGGEQQRVAIARALINDPLLVLADEPTGNLDEETGTSVLILLDELTRQSGKNLVMVTHSREAASYADRILLLRDHQLLEG